MPTPAVAFTYDEQYPRVVQMTDGIGTSLYSYNPVAAMPRLGANRLARVEGPLPNATVSYDYDELGTVKVSASRARVAGEGSATHAVPHVESSGMGETCSGVGSERKGRGCVL